MGHTQNGDYMCLGVWSKQVLFNKEGGAALDQRYII